MESCLAEGQSDIALSVEDLRILITKLETEADYHQFFDKISEPYSKVENVSKMPSVPLSDGYLFVLHRPIMLAHINPLHRMLDLNGKNNREENVALVVLDDVVVRNLGAPSIKLGSLFIQQVISNHNQKLQEIEKQMDKTPARDLAVHAKFFSVWQLNITDLSWWSLKFHPY